MKIASEKKVKCLIEREAIISKEQEDSQKRSSYEEHKGNALALGADEGRDKLRKAAGSCK